MRIEDDRGDEEKEALKEPDGSEGYWPEPSEEEIAADLAEAGPPAEDCPF